MYERRPKNVKKKLELSQFFQYLDHSEETFDHKLGNLFEKRASGLVLLSAVFEVFQSQIKVHGKWQNLTKISIFSNLRSIMSHFPTEVCNISLKAYWIMSSDFVERLQNDSKSTQVAQK